MKMTDRFSTDPLQYLLSVGFELASLEVMKAQFGENDYQSIIRCGDYAIRKTSDGKWQYLFICRFEGKAVEVTFEEYLAPKNTRKPKGEPKKENLKPGEYTENQKKGFDNIRCGLCRSIEDVQEKLNNV
jgi:hypothetical protein